MDRKFILLRKLSFLGPNVVTAELDFERGLNVICGESNTGKSFAINAIDFMLGREALMQIPELLDYEDIHLEVETGNLAMFTFKRNKDGGERRLTEGDTEIKLNLRHSQKKTNSASSWLLDKIGLFGKTLKATDTGTKYNNFTFRYLAKLILVREDDIMKAESPFLKKGNYSGHTADYSALKLLLTGLDDTKIERVADNFEFATRIELLDELISEHALKLENVGTEERLNQLLLTLESSIEEKRLEMSDFQSDLDKTIADRRELLKTKEEFEKRYVDISEMLARFELLQRHYQIDIKRLSAIEESGSLFFHYDKVECPLCGSPPNAEHTTDDCVGDVSATVLASKMEIRKIRSLLDELKQTTKNLDTERESVSVNQKELAQKYKTVDETIKQAVSINFLNEQREHTRLIEKKNEVERELYEIVALSKLTQRRDEQKSLIEEKTLAEKIVPKKTEIPEAQINILCSVVENILNVWGLPEASPVTFDTAKKDFLLLGKERALLGKGYRAITHAAITIALLEYCQTEGLPHPGFVILDSPLLGYYSPENDKDSLEGTNLEENFYSYLIKHHSMNQIIVIENERPSNDFDNSIKLHCFTKTKEGRYGLFPHKLAPQI